MHLCATTCTPLVVLTWTPAQTLCRRSDECWRWSLNTALGNGNHIARWEERGLCNTAHLMWPWPQDRTPAIGKYLLFVLSKTATRANPIVYAHLLSYTCTWVNVWDIIILGLAPMQYFLVDNVTPSYWQSGVKGNSLTYFFTMTYVAMTIEA